MDISIRIKMGVQNRNIHIPYFLEFYLHLEIYLHLEKVVEAGFEKLM